MNAYRNRIVRLQYVRAWVARRKERRPPMIVPRAVIHYGQRRSAGSPIDPIFGSGNGIPITSPQPECPLPPDLHRKPVKRTDTQDELRDRRALARERHGLFCCGAFAAARRCPSIQYSGVVLPPGPNSWSLNIPADCRFQPAPRLSVGETALGYECGAFATYRPVSCASTSTICRCITACARRYSQWAACRR
jgi:hypothetical protein